MKVFWQQDILIVIVCTLNWYKKLLLNILTLNILFSKSMRKGKTKQTHRLHKYYFSLCMPQNRHNITGLNFLILYSAIVQQFISNYSALVQQFISNYSAIVQQFISNYSAIVQQIISNYSAIVQQSFSNSEPQVFPSIRNKRNTLYFRSLPGSQGGSLWESVFRQCCLKWEAPAVFNCSAVTAWFFGVVGFCVTYCWWRSILCHLLLVS